MSKKFSFWIYGAIIAQWLSGLFHSLSFFAEQSPANESEKQLLALLKNYKMNMGAGIERSFMDIFISLSACFSLLCFFAGTANLFLFRKKAGNDLWKGLLLIELFFFGILFILMLRFTFLPPMICTGLIFFFLIGAWFVSKNMK